MENGVPQLSTKITEMLGIRYPVFQGGMAWVADASIASAVSNAGGLGIIGMRSVGYRHDSGPGEGVQRKDR